MRWFGTQEGEETAVVFVLGDDGRPVIEGAATTSAVRLVRPPEWTGPDGEPVAGLAGLDDGGRVVALVPVPTDDDEWMGAMGDHGVVVLRDGRRSRELAVDPELLG